MDYGKHLYSLNKKKKGAKVKQIKQIEIRPNTEEADLTTKTNKIIKFLQSGHKVKIAVKYRGREMAHQDIALEKLNIISKNISSFGKPEGKPMLDGRKHQVIITPC